MLFVDLECNLLPLGSPDRHSAVTEHIPTSPHRRQSQGTLPPS
jgi:hypothetical protein